MSQEKAKTVLEIATVAHAQMKIDPVRGQGAIATGMAEIGKIRAGAVRKDLIEFCDMTETFLSRMSAHNQYHSAFGASLDALGRRSENVREDVIAN